MVGGQEDQVTPADYLVPIAFGGWALVVRGWIRKANQR